MLRHLSHDVLGERPALTRDAEQHGRAEARDNLGEIPARRVGHAAFGRERRRPRELALIRVGDLTILGFTIPPVQPLVILTAIAAMLFLYLIVQKTKMGTAMRAVAEDRDAAAMMGIDVNKVIIFTFILGGCMAGIGGVLYCMVYKQVYFYMGFLPGIKAFSAAVLGGIGNIPGAMVGGFFLGVVESVGPALFLDGIGIKAPYQLRDLIAFTMLVMVLIFRPQGLLGERLATKRA